MVGSKIADLTEPIIRRELNLAGSISLKRTINVAVNVEKQLT